MESNSLSLSVRVGREVDSFSVGSQFFKLSDDGGGDRGTGEGGR